MGMGDLTDSVLRSVIENDKGALLLPLSRQTANPVLGIQPDESMKNPADGSDLETVPAFVDARDHQRRVGSDLAVEKPKPSVEQNQFISDHA